MEAGRERLRSTGKVLLGGRVPIACPRTTLRCTPGRCWTSTERHDDYRDRRRRHHAAPARPTSPSAADSSSPGRGCPAESVTAGEDDTSFSSAAELLALASGTGRSISEVMLARECRTRAPSRCAPSCCISATSWSNASSAASAAPGCCPASYTCVAGQGRWYERLNQEDPHRDPRFAEDWVNLVALAVNEENAPEGAS